MTQPVRIDSHVHIYETREIGYSEKTGFDCCEIIDWTGSPNGPSEVELARLIRDIGSHRVVMGSDFPW